MTARHEHLAAEAEYGPARLVDGHGFDAHDTAVRLGFRGTGFKHGGAGMEGVTDMHRVEMLDPLIFEIGDGLTADIPHGHANDEAEDEGADDEHLAVLGLTRVFPVEMDWMMVHGEQAEQIVIRLGDRLPGLVVVNIAKGEVIE